jgi:hypothetical protein
MDAAQLAGLNAVVASEMKAWKDAGDTREERLIIDDIVARLPSIGPALAQMRRRVTARQRTPTRPGDVVKIRCST